MEDFLNYCSCYYLLRRRRNNQFDVHFWRITLVIFSFEKWKIRDLLKKKWTEMCFSRQRRHFSFIDIIVKVLFAICTLNYRVKIFVSRQGKTTNRRNESTTNSLWICSLWPCTHFWNHYLLAFVETLFLHNRGDRYLLLQFKKHFCLHNWQNFSFRSMPTLRNKRKSAPVSRETPEKNKKPPVAKQIWSGNGSRLHLPGFCWNWKAGQ